MAASALHPALPTALRDASPWLGLAAWAASLALCLWLLSGWILAALSPPPETVPPAELPTAQEAAKAIAGRAIFAAQGDAGNPPAAAGWRLVGVSAASGKTGRRQNFAILRDTNGNAFSALEGEEFQPGVFLRRIRADGVEIEQAGTRRDVRLEGVSPALPPSSPPEARPR